MSAIFILHAHPYGRAGVITKPTKAQRFTFVGARRGAFLLVLWGRVPMAGDLSLLERERPSSSSSAEEEEGPGKRKRVHREVAARPVLGTAAS